VHQDRVIFSSLNKIKEKWDLFMDFVIYYSHCYFINVSSLEISGSPLIWSFIKVLFERISFVSYFLLRVEYSFFSCNICCHFAGLNTGYNSLFPIYYFFLWLYFQNSIVIVSLINGRTFLYICFFLWTFLLLFSVVIGEIFRQLKMALGELTLDGKK